MSYIDQGIINGFEAKRDEKKFNYKKLIGLLRQLNTNYRQGYEYACYLLIKAILNHIPPLLNLPDFNQLANNYSWSSDSHRKYALYLKDSFIEEAHDVTHTRISAREDRLSLDVIAQAKTQLNTILEECLTHTVATAPSFTVKPQATKPSKQKQKTTVKLTSTTLEWANYAGFGPSFQCRININNYGNERLNYIERVKISATTGGGSAYEGENFKFESERANERLKILPEEIKDTTFLIAVDSDSTSMEAPHPLPDIDHDTVKLTFYFADGTKTTQDIAAIIKR